MSLRFLLLALVAAAAALLGTRERDVRAELAEIGQRAAAQARGAAESRETEARRERLAEVLDRLSPAPGDAAGARETLLALARSAGVEVPETRFEPLQRPPTGALGSDVRLTAAGPAASLVRFLERLESSRLPVRLDRADLSMRAVGPATLTAFASVLWPDPGTPPDPDGLAADPRLDALLAWLDEPPPAPVAPAPRVQPVAVAAHPPEIRRTDVAPVLRGFVETDGAVRAMFAFGGEAIMAGAGDPVGEYAVLELEPPAGATLVRAGRPPLRLTLQ